MISPPALLQTLTRRPTLNLQPTTISGKIFIYCLDLGSILLGLTMQQITPQITPQMQKKPPANKGWGRLIYCICYENKWRE